MREASHTEPTFTHGNAPQYNGNLRGGTFFGASHSMMVSDDNSARGHQANGGKGHYRLSRLMVRELAWFGASQRSVKPFHFASSCLVFLSIHLRFIGQRAINPPSLITLISSRPSMFHTSGH